MTYGEKKLKQYPNGYQGKLDYWNGQLEIAIGNGDQNRIIKAIDKLAWFTKKQNELKDQALEKFLKK